MKRATRLVAGRADATRAVRLIAFDSAPILPGFDRAGALIAKKAAETIRKVWMFLVFMRTPCLTALLPRSRAECAALHGHCSQVGV